MVNRYKVSLRTIYPDPRQYLSTAGPPAAVHSASAAFQGNGNRRDGSKETELIGRDAVTRFTRLIPSSENGNLISSRSCQALDHLSYVLTNASWR